MSSSSGNQNRSDVGTTKHHHKNQPRPGKEVVEFTRSLRQEKRIELPDQHSKDNRLREPTRAPAEMWDHHLRLCFFTSAEHCGGSLQRR